jgi:hypothetical protein
MQTKLSFNDDLFELVQHAANIQQGLIGHYDADTVQFVFNVDDADMRHELTLPCKLDIPDQSPLIMTAQIQEDRYIVDFVQFAHDRMSMVDGMEDDLMAGFMLSGMFMEKCVTWRKVNHLSVNGDLFPVPGAVSGFLVNDIQSVNGVTDMAMAHSYYLSSKIEKLSTITDKSQKELSHVTLCDCGGCKQTRRNLRRKVLAAMPELKAEFGLEITDPMATLNVLYLPSTKTLRNYFRSIKDGRIGIGKKIHQAGYRVANFVNPNIADHGMFWALVAKKEIDWNDALGKLENIQNINDLNAFVAANKESILALHHANDFDDAVLNATIFARALMSN